MTESIFIRLKRILNGSVADLADSFESSQSETVLRETIREVEHALADVRAEVTAATTRRLHAVRQKSLLQSKLAELAEKAALALAEARDDIAEALVARQLDLEAMLPTLETTEREAAVEQADLAKAVAILEARRREMTESLDAFAAARRQALKGAELSDELAEAAAPGTEARKRAARASEAFDRAMRNAGGAAMPTFVGEGDAAAKIAELDAITRSRRVAERIDALRERVARGGEAA